MLQQAISQNFMRKRTWKYLARVHKNSRKKLNLLYTIPHWSKEIPVKFAQYEQVLPYRFPHRIQELYNQQ